MSHVGMSFYVCLQNLALFQIRLSPFPNFKIDSKENGNFFSYFNTSIFGFRGVYLSSHQKKKGQEQAVSMFDFFSS